MNRVLLRKLGRDLRARKGALAALWVIVAIGIGVFTGFASLYRDLDGSRERYYSAYRLADFTVDLKRAPGWAVETAASLPNVREVRGRVDFAVLLDLPTMEEPISGRAISMPGERSPVLNDVLLRSGSWFSDRWAKEVILNDAFARENGLRPGDRVKVVLLDQQHDLLIVGTAMSPEFVYLMPPGAGLAPDPARFGVLYLPEAFLQESCDLDGAFNQLIGTVYDDSPPVLAATLRLIEERLDGYGVTLTTPAADQLSVRFLADELMGLKVTATVMPAIFLGVAALVLNILLGRMIALQRPIIGTLKALGYSSWAITRHYLAYGLIVGFIGGVLGLLFGFWFQGTYVGLYRQFFALPSIEAHFYADILLGGLMLSVLFALLGTVNAVRRAARLEPAEAMRPPPPEKGHKVLPERVPALWRPLPFRWKMILRGVFRNPFRSGVSILASVISTALILSALSMVDALDYLMSYEFEKVSHQDLTVSLRDPVGREAIPEVVSLPTIAYAEPQLSLVCDLSTGPYSKRIGVTGVPAAGRLFTPLDREERPIGVPDSGLVLTRKLAEILHVGLGDTVQLRPLIGLRTPVQAPVMGLVDSFFGLSAYANLGYLSRLIGEEWVANVILSDSFRAAAEPALLEALQERPVVVGITERVRALTRLDESFGQTMGIAISVMVLFAGLIAFGSVLNTALVSLSERRREVGSLRVLGYTPAQVSRIFSGESLLLGGLGILAGLLAGVGLAHFMAYAYNTELYRFPAVIYPSRLVMTSGLMVGFLGLSQLIIYRMIRKMDWLEVLKVKE